MVGKIGNTDMRSEGADGGGAANYNYSGSNGSPHCVNTNRVRVLAAALAKKSTLRVDSLDAATKADYDELNTIINNYKNYPNAYDPIYNAIMDEFKLVTVAAPGTIAAAIKGGELSSTCGSPECNPMFLQAILKNPATTRRPCDRNSIMIKNDGTIMPLQNNGMSSSAYIYLENPQIKFTPDHIRQFNNMNISDMVVYGMLPGGGCQPMYDGKTINTDKLIVIGGASTTVVGGVFNRCGLGNWNGFGSGSGRNWWWWLVGLIILILIIVVIALIIWLIVRAVKSKNKADTAEEGCGTVKKCVDYVKNACSRTTATA